MLTEQALADRKWGSFPALRSVLETKRSSDRAYGVSSVSDNVFEKLQRLVEVAAVAQEHKEELLAAARSDPRLRSEAAGELAGLSSYLRTLTRSFDREIDALRALSEEVSQQV